MSWPAKAVAAGYKGRGHIERDSDPMDDVTHILHAIDAGEPGAADRLLPLVYDELRRLAAARMAAERPGHTLDATGLVHEAYLRLVGGQRFAGRGHFFAAAAEAMRRILVEAARAAGHPEAGRGGRPRPAGGGRGRRPPRTTTACWRCTRRSTSWPRPTPTPPRW